MSEEKVTPELQEEEVAEATPKKEEVAEATPKKEKKKKSDKKSEVDALTAQVEALTAQVEALNAEIEAMKDAHLRVLAEYSNFRNRSQREKEATYGDAKANTLKMLLPVLDNFDRAADNKTDDIEIYRKGIEMTLTQLSDILKNLEVEAYGEVGDEFDPNIHSAVMTVENPDLPENSVAGVFEKGYKMGDRILRFATVQVTN